MAQGSTTARHFDGTSLYGDDMSEGEIGAWFAQEQEGYYNLTLSYDDFGTYAYSALNEHYAWSKIKGNNFARCLVLGCADGKDVLPIASSVANFTAVEPAIKWWRDDIGGTPSNYIMPSASGRLEIAAEAHDLAISLGVLHHIPNVSTVLAEIHRTLRPGGLLIVREPIHSMGDWTKQRVGLTKNERGLPLGWLRSQLDEIGFDRIETNLCMFPPLSKMAKKIGIKHPYNSPVIVAADDFLSRVFSGRLKYHRTSFVAKVAPSNVFLVATKR